MNSTQPTAPSTPDSLTNSLISSSYKGDMMTNSIDTTSTSAADQVVNINKPVCIPSYSGIYTSTMVKAESPLACSTYIASRLEELNTIDVVAFGGNYEALAMIYDALMIGLVVSVIEGKLDRETAGKQARYVGLMFGECIHDVRDVRGGKGIDTMVLLAADIVSQTSATVGQALQRASEIVQDFVSK